MDRRGASRGQCGLFPLPRPKSCISLPCSGPGRELAEAGAVGALQLDAAAALNALAAARARGLPRPAWLSRLPHGRG
eukprot:8793100-Pyramimonas_sp.AAC.1